MPDITIRQMFEAGIHFGHQTRFWNPKMAPYIFGERNKIHIINLDKTLHKLKKAMDFLQASAADGKTILFVATKKPAQDIVKKYATQCGMPYVTCRWLGGTLTNFKTIRQSIKRYDDLLERQEKTKFVDLNKKQKLLQEREMQKMERTLGGLRNMPRLPDVLFVIDVRYEMIAVKEAVKLGLPVVAVVDSNSQFDDIDYMIPGNDDSMRAIELYAATAADAVLKGLEDREARSEATVTDEETDKDESDEKEEGPQVKVRKKVGAKAQESAREPETEITQEEEE